MNKLTLRKNIQRAGFKDINNETKQMLLEACSKRIVWLFVFFWVLFYNNLII